jgi:hypothetical protein
MPVDSPDPVVVEDQGRSLTRIYLIAAVVALDVLALVGGLVYRRVSVSRLAARYEGRAVAAVQRFAVTVWPGVRAWAADAAALDPAALRASPQVSEIGQGLISLTTDLNVVDAEVYVSDGIVVYATQADTIGSAVTDPVITDLLAGRYYRDGRSGVRTEVGTRSASSGASQTSGSLRVVTTQVAIRGSNTVRVEAVASISQDATSEIHAIATVEVIGVVGVVVTSAFFLALVLFAVRPRRLQKEE